MLKHYYEFGAEIESLEFKRRCLQCNCKGTFMFQSRIL